MGVGLHMALVRPNIGKVLEHLLGHLVERLVEHHEGLKELVRMDLEAFSDFQLL